MRSITLSNPVIRFSTYSSGHTVILYTSPQPSDKYQRTLNKTADCSDGNIGDFTSGVSSAAPHCSRCARYKKGGSFSRRWLVESDLVAAPQEQVQAPSGDIVLVRMSLCMTRQKCVLLSIVLSTGSIILYSMVNGGPVTLLRTELRLDTPQETTEIYERENTQKLEEWQRALCKSSVTDEPEYSQTLTLPMLARDITPNASDYNVYLSETGCNPRPLYRAWCSVESFALQNPTAKIWYVITAPYVDDTDSLVTILSERYKNLEVVGADLDKMFTGTPLEKLFKSGKWTRNTPWPANNLSNLLRNVLLWRWGGLNADTDCICVRNVTHLRNTLSYDEKDRVANNAIMHFEARHRFVLATMEYLKRNFKVATWHVNGPGAASHIVQELCGTKDLSQLLSRKCDSVELMPLKNMQLYNWKEWKNFFEKGKGSKFTEDHKDAYILHMYNKLSKKRAVEIGSQTIYDSVASVVCPLTYEAAKRRAYFF
ncbi:lactosylceramide 4-alpha-galactosyltransferase [Penaeus vannamei]|uniref:Lactosylceramide 4-alpha-galactosyltransferase n=1 Tax=Penaeus vannamei TaxID=6689 RepID=A0A423U4G6_PENVA|nr:lactosylceramide 4-alpha-galactosyltransferase [Penaeus vannamei]